MRSNDNKRQPVQTTLSFVNTGEQWAVATNGTGQAFMSPECRHDVVLNFNEEMTDAGLYLQLPPESQRTYKGTQGDSATTGLS